MDVSCGSPQASTRAEQCWQIDLTRKRKTRGDRERRRRSVERMSWGDGGKEEGATCCKFKMHPSPSACLPRKETDGRGLKGGGGGISSPTQKCVHRGIAISQMNAFSSIHCLTYAKKPSNNNESYLLLSKGRERMATAGQGSMTQGISLRPQQQEQNSPNLGTILKCIIMITGVLQAPCTLYREPELINYRTIIVHFEASLTPVEASSD